jgi:DNA-binding sugar fermentation-stimulating protein
MISAKAEGEDILINSAFHRYISENLLNDGKLSPFGKVERVQAEVKYGKSRIDYLLHNGEERIWVEVKGVSLSQDKIAMFPDSPSERAQKHLVELMELKENGDRAGVLLLVLRDSKEFRPKWETDPRFSELFYKAIEKGVEVYPVQLAFEDDNIVYKHLLPIGENRYLEEFDMDYKSLKIGDKLENKEIAEAFGCSNQGGIRKSKKTNTVVCLAKFTACSYKHKKDGDIVYFTGMGKKGDQTLARQNKALANATKEGFDIHLFAMYEEGIYTYEGRRIIDGDIGTDRQVDDNGEERDVLVFPLRTVGN